MTVGKLELRRRQLKHMKIFEVQIREPQSACSNLEPPVSLKGTSSSCPETQCRLSKWRTGVDVRRRRDSAKLAE